MMMHQRTILSIPLFMWAILLQRQGFVSLTHDRIQFFPLSIFEVVIMLLVVDYPSLVLDHSLDHVMPAYPDRIIPF